MKKEFNTYIKEKFLYILIFSFLFFITDIILTVAYNKYLQIKKIKPINYSNNDAKVRIENKIYHHGFLPMSDVVEDNGKFGKVRLITNSLGFKDSKKRKIDLKKNKKRIVFLGDSYVEGILLDYENTFVGQIDRLIGHNFEILNAGMSSYSPSIYFAKTNYLIKKGLEFDDLIVFIDTSDIEDEYKFYTFNSDNNSVLSKKQKLSAKKKIKYFVKNNMFVTYNVIQIRKLIFKKKLNPNHTNEEFIDYISSKKFPRQYWTISKDIYNQYKEGIEKSKFFIKKLNSLCKKNNIKLTIVVFPSIPQIYHNDLDSRQVKIWEKIAIDNKINFINLFPIFINPENELDARISVIKKYFIQYDVHFNTEGNKLIADFILKNYNF